MNRDFLRELGLTDEQVNSVMAENGKDINAEKKKIEELKEDSTKLAEASKQIASLTEELKKTKETADANITLLAERDAKIKDYEISATKAQVAHELGISYDAIEFLQGDNEETIRSSAESLKNLIGTQKTMPLASTEGGQVNQENAALKDMLKNLF